MEIERKFIPKYLPDHLEDYPYHEIEQGYLCTDPAIRIRKMDDSYFLTYKSSGLMAREEYEMPLTQEAYLHLRKKTDGMLITKRRYLIPLHAERTAHSPLAAHDADTAHSPLTAHDADTAHSPLAAHDADTAHSPLAAHNAYTIELDLFHGELHGIALAEVEFASVEEAESFIPPEWFGEDVTYDGRYHNSAMSRGSLTALRTADKNT